MSFLLLLLAACKKEDEPAVVLDTLEVAQRLAAQTAAEHPPESLGFGWIPAVWGWGLLELDKADPDGIGRAQDQAWMTAELPAFTDGDPPELRGSDDLASAQIASRLMEVDGSLDLTPITDVADAYLAGASRTSEGAIEHWAPDNELGEPHQVWVDSIFMLGLYLLAEHGRTGDPADLAAFLEQYALFSDLCRDPETALYRHAYDAPSGENVPADAVFWARGNSWVLVAAAEALARIGEGDPAWDDLQADFLAQAEAVRALQADDGLWRTVLNDPVTGDPDNYSETAASALIAWSFVRGLEAGALTGDEWALSVSAAVNGLLDRLVEQGGRLVLQGTSLGTVPGDYAYYVSVPTADDLLLGDGAVVAALAAAHDLPVPESE